ncbi:MAG: hypothetical protein M1351_02180 [Candidatus Thermoplasmatota archaeon]|nr:hypothetical protein [Candidatus Thermoplasmatota archaeon]
MTAKYIAIMIAGLLIAATAGVTAYLTLGAPDSHARTLTVLPAGWKMPLYSGGSVNSSGSIMLFSLRVKGAAPVTVKGAWNSTGGCSLSLIYFYPNSTSLVKTVWQTGYALSGALNFSVPPSSATWEVMITPEVNVTETFTVVSPIVFHVPAGDSVEYHAVPVPAGG